MQRTEQLCRERRLLEALNMKTPSIRRRTPGFTLVELMIVVALLGVFAALAGPPFVDYLSLQRLRGASSELVTDMAFARSESISRRAFVQLRVQTSTTTPPYSCYSIVARTDPDTTTMCDCLQGPGNACTGLPYTEIKTVVLPTQLSLTSVAPTTSTVHLDALTFNPRNATIYLDSYVELTGIRAFIVDTQLDSVRRIRSIVEAGGRARNCLPAGANVTGVEPC
jgi:prepilin-type N-terminal cleavage/methylation domain-containing protein